MLEEIIWEGKLTSIDARSTVKSGEQLVSPEEVQQSLVRFTEYRNGHATNSRIQKFDVSVDESHIGKQIKYHSQTYALADDNKVLTINRFYVEGVLISNQPIVYKM